MTHSCFHGALKALIRGGNGQQQAAAPGLALWKQAAVCVPRSFVSFRASRVEEGDGRRGDRSCRGKRVGAGGEMKQVLERHTAATD